MIYLSLFPFQFSGLLGEYFFLFFDYFSSFSFLVCFFIASILFLLFSFDIKDRFVCFIVLFCVFCFVCCVLCVLFSRFPPSLFVSKDRCEVCEVWGVRRVHSFSLSLLSCDP